MGGAIWSEGVLGWCLRRIDGAFWNRIVGSIHEGVRGIHLPLSDGRAVGYRCVFREGFGGMRGLERRGRWLKTRRWPLRMMGVVRRGSRLMPF